MTNERELTQLRRWRDEMRALPPELIDDSRWSKLGDALAAAAMYAEARESHESAVKATGAWEVRPFDFGLRCGSRGCMRK